MKATYRVGSIFWLIFGMYVAIHATQLGVGRLNRPGPGSLFFLAGLLLAVLSAIDLAATFIGKPSKESYSEEQPVWAGLRWPKVLYVLTGLSAYVLVFDIAGFFLSTLFLLIFLFKIVEPVKWWIAIISSLTTVLFSYLIFKIWLEVQFPSGFLGF